MYKNLFTKGFLLFLVLAILILCYKVFAPFIDEILISAVLVSIFYKSYESLVKVFRGWKHIAALVMCLLIVLVVIFPFVNFVVYAAERSVEGYTQIVAYVNNANFDGLANHSLIQKAGRLGLNSASLKDVLIDVVKMMNDWLVQGATTLIKGTTNFFVSVVLILLTMFFFFVDGQRMLEKFMYWTPLPNKYDKQLFSKFKDVSQSTMISTFVTAIAQGLVGALGFFVIGLPAFFPGIAMAFLSILPYFGTGIIWFPTVIYLLVIGKIWQAIFLAIWGVAVIGMIDNLIRAYIIKGKAQVHPIFLIFSILGGIALFGFWGVVFGPLIISLAITILHIYEMEYESVLEK